MQSEPGAPASDGGIALCIPEIAGNEWQYVKECLDTGWVSSVGSFVNRFERDVAARLGCEFAIATVSGTAALHVAMLLAGVEPDDEVIVSTLTFISPANAIRYAGAWPVFVDAEPTYWQLDPEKLNDFLERDCERRDGGLWNRHTGRRVRALLPVHILGHPCDMDPIVAIAQQYELPVIEDATEGFGASYRDQAVGTIGQIGCLSFNGNKLITTGGGGMLVTNDPVLARKARYLTTQAKDDPVEFVHGQIGFNYRLSNVQAAMGCAQLEQLDDFIAAKRRIAERYAAAFADVPGLDPMREAPWAHSVFWMHTTLVDEAAFGMDSRALLKQFAAENIQCRPLWQPIHLSAAHQQSYAAPCDVAERLQRDALSLPCSSGLTLQDQERVIAVISNVAAARAGS